MTASPIKGPSGGFTLLEMSLCLFIFGLLSSGLLISLSAQRSMAEIQAAEKQLAEIREVIIGFALTHGRLPCPAKPELPAPNIAPGLEDCSLQHGVLPWVTLAIQESDPWDNRFTYYASNRFTAPLPAGSNASFTLETAGNANILDGTGKTIASDLPLVIISHGRNAAGAYNRQGVQLPAGSSEEKENADADLTFIAHLATPTFDDLVIWINPSVLNSRMVAAGKLP